MHNKSFRHVSFRHLDSFFFYTQRLVLHSQSIFQSFKRLFSLQNGLTVLLTTFLRKQRAKSVSVEKGNSEECRSYLFCVSIKLQFQNTWITLTSNSKMLQIIFSCAWNAIYTFTKLLLCMQIEFIACTLPQLFPCVCKSLSHYFTFLCIFALIFKNKDKILWTMLAEDTGSKHRRSGEVHHLRWLSATQQILVRKYQHQTPVWKQIKTICGYFFSVTCLNCHAIGLVQPNLKCM